MSGAVLACIATKTTPLTVTLSAGASQGTFGNNISTKDFGNNSASVSGGSGSYSYAWTQSPDANGSWTLGSPSAGVTDVRVGSVAVGLTTHNTVTCTVTDNATGRKGSASTAYTYTNLSIF